MAQQDTKDRIFTTAVRLFFTKGYHGTSIRTLAKAVGIKESTLYYYYPGKEALLDTIFDYYKQSFEAAIPTAEEIKADARKHADPVERWMQGSLGLFEKFPPLMEPIMGILFNEMLINEKCRYFVLHEMIPIHRKLTITILQDFAERGEIKDIDIAETARQYVYMFLGIGLENMLRIIEGDEQEAIQADMFQRIEHFVKTLIK